MASQEQHPSVPYDPLLETPNSPRLSMHPPSGQYPSPGASPAFTPGELDPPRPDYFAHTTSATSSLRESKYGSIAPLQRESTAFPAAEDGTGSGQFREKGELYAAPRTKTRRKLLWVAIAAGVVLLIIAVVVGVYFGVIKPKNGGSDGSGSSHSGNNSGNNNGNNDGNHHSQSFTTWGGDGSTVTKDDGTTFVYNNSFGGYWVYDPENPLNNSARAQSYTPPLSEEWPWGSQNIYGVNLGGWLVLEPFITPSLYEPFYPDAVDEWTLSTLIKARDGNLDAIEEHYKTFITEEDFAQIAAAGLNWVRIPFPFWAIEVYPGEPFLPKTAWTYFLKAIEWARKYGLRINLDLHAVPGSQNGWNHSGKLGEIDLLNGVMGLANAQRTMDYIRVIAEFISQPEYAPVVPFFGILNEPLGTTIPKTALRQFYAEAYRVLRAAGNGYGAGKSPYLSIHEAFLGVSDWIDFLPGADRIALDVHPYLIFTTISDTPASAFPAQACGNFAGMMSDSMASFGLTGAGEWSNAINDCGLYVNAVGVGSRYEGTYDGNARIGSCDQWNDYSTWDDATKESIRQLGAASMDSLGNWFFWTWKIGPSSTNGKVMAPFWSYQLALQEGWAVKDPRTSAGFCSSIGLTGMTFTGPLSANQLGQDTSPSTPDLATYSWPPTTIGGFEGAANTLPSYTPTGPIPTLPVPTFSNAATSATPTVSLGNGWNNPSDTDLMNVPVDGCTYPDPWAAVNAAVTSCSA